MQIRYEPVLLDAVVSALIQEREATGDLHFTHEYHALTDAAYRLDLAAREEAFQQIHRRLFRRWNLAAPIEAAFTEFPELREHIQTLWGVRARAARVERVALQVPGRAAAIVHLVP